MTPERARAIVSQYGRIEETRTYLKVAADQERPLGRLQTLLGNLGHHAPQELLTECYDKLRLSIRVKADELEKELQAIPEQ